MSSTDAPFPEKLFWAGRHGYYLNGAVAAYLIHPRTPNTVLDSGAGIGWLCGSVKCVVKTLLHYALYVLLTPSANAKISDAALES